MPPVAIILTLLMQYGPTVVADVMNFIKQSPDCPTADQLAQLHKILKPAEQYFTISATPTGGQTQ